MHAMLSWQQESKAPANGGCPNICASCRRIGVINASEAIDFTKLAGRTVAVLGAGASAFDNAATALEAGARAVHVFWRRDQLQRVQPYKHISYTGFLRHLGDLPDDKRWRIMRHLLTLREAFPAETWARVTRHQNAHLHAGCDWSDATLDDDGAILLHTSTGPFRCDHVIVGTGFEVDTAVCPLLGPLSPRIARWCDRYQPPDELRDDRLAQYPYLGQHFQLLPRSGQTDQALSRLKLFTFGATMSFGPSGLCRECGGNSRSAPPGRVGMTQLRRLRQERRVRRADRGFPIRRPSASGSGRMRAAPTEAWARFPVSAGPSGS